MLFINPTTCTGCGGCINVCPADAITMQGATAVLDRSLCRQCGICVNQCPVQAISEVERAGEFPGETGRPRGTGSGSGSSWRGSGGRGRCKHA